MTSEFVLGVPHLYLDHKGGGAGTTVKNEFVTVTTTLKNKTTGRYAGQEKVTYSAAQDDSMDVAIPIDPDTGLPFTNWQPKLPAPEIKPKKGHRGKRTRLGSTALDFFSKIMPGNSESNNNS